VGDRVCGFEHRIGIGDADRNHKRRGAELFRLCLTSPSAAASRAIKARLAPARAKRSATARPTPAEAPAMTTVVCCRLRAERGIV
jgi:hypothetical protein